MPAEKKIRSAAKLIGIVSVIAAFGVSTLACSQTYVSSADLTATASDPTAPSPTLVSSPLLIQTTIAPSSIPTFTFAPIIPTELPSVTVTQTSPVPETPGISPTAKPLIMYYTQSGDTLPSIAFRFSVSVEQIQSAVKELPQSGLIMPKTLLLIPDILPEVGPKGINFPDSEVVYSPSALDFDAAKFITDADGYLATYNEDLSSGNFTGIQLVKRVAIENSVNPRLLLALLEYQSHWVYGKPDSISATEYPMGNPDYHYKGLYRQLSWAVSQLSIGYYGWRAGILTTVTFPGHDPLHLDPQLNAGTVAVQYLFAQLIKDPLRWMGALNGPGSVIELYQKMFGNPWQRAETVEPLYPPSLTQPSLELPFEIGHTWSFTGGPHSAWGPQGALAAIDFAPRADASGCQPSTEWVTAVAPGRIIRSENGVVILDLDNDGVEQTGWDILYLHIATADRVAVGTFVDTNDHIGHPSCEGGVATGTHVHIARKFNGEWILADGAVPFVLSGYTAHYDFEDYQGTLVKGSTVITANSKGMYMSLITRTK